MAEEEIFLSQQTLNSERFPSNNSKPKQDKVKPHNNWAWPLNKIFPNSSAPQECPSCSGHKAERRQESQERERVTEENRRLRWELREREDLFRALASSHEKLLLEKEDLLSELEQLSQSLFQEANRMVAEERIRSSKLEQKNNELAASLERAMRVMSTTASSARNKRNSIAVGTGLQPSQMAALRNTLLREGSNNSVQLLNLVQFRKNFLTRSGLSPNDDNLLSFDLQLPSTRHNGWLSDIHWCPDMAEMYKRSPARIQYDGRLAAMQNVTSDTAKTKIWDIGKEYDLEGISVIEDKEDLVYLGVEHPAAVLEYNVTSATIQKKWDIQPIFEAFPATTVTTTLERRKKPAKPKAQVDTSLTNAGLESLLFVRSPSPSSAALGHFLVGRQADARVFIFTALKTGEELDLKHVGTFSPPGPATDLSALTIHSNALYLLYDKPKQLVSLPLTTIYSLLDDNLATDLSVDLSTTQGVHTFTSSSRGWEGISFFEENGTNYVIIGVDPPKKKGNKDLLLWTEDTFFACTSRV
ncbi:hypothetical protein BC832DRAFT_539926 [Gaertneriomyces semiglobifer]|nr:hypothetical protein BC832DRAFT_539926 [Gaertneriomyces semiglobifer]